ncbi:hypothetical protein [Paraburkholderia franconis]|uniref:hypothetical protein n=1 Tax=Paraburkholderia franconis TaxID=2654983 RepID=UPI00128E5903|nr:hypothetical protein [Paraburkholderia franconis]
MLQPAGFLNMVALSRRSEACRLFEHAEQEGVDARTPARDATDDELLLLVTFELIQFGERPER